MKRIILILVLVQTLGMGYSSHAQSFFPLGAGTNNPIYCLFPDSVNNSLYVGGQFTIAGNIYCEGIAKWDGAAWDSLQNNLFTNTKGINTLNGELYIGGGVGFFDTSSAQWQFAGITKWDAINYLWLRIDTPKTNGVVYDILNYNNNLYVSGQFDTIGGIYSSKIARYDGTNWYSFPPLDINGGGPGILCSIFYNGELYVGGNFHGTAGPDLSDIAKWDGTQWQPVGVGLSGFGWVTDFTIYQGKLIVAGWMKTSWGEPGNGVAAWDGMQWTQFGSGLSAGTVWDVEIYNGELWAGGAINDAGGVPVTFLAKWNGTQWQSLGITLDNVVTSLAVLGNDLYIAGGFWTMNGDTVNRIIRYNTVTGFESLQPKNKEIEIIPNPFTDVIKVADLKMGEQANIVIYDLMGEKVFEKELPSNKTEAELNLSFLQQGVYFLNVKSSGGSWTRKIVKM